MELTILAQEGQQPSALVGMLPFLLIMLIFYFLLIVPQRKQAKAHAQMVAELQKGDQVVTNGGLMGDIVGIKDDAVQIRSGSSTVVVERRAVARRVGPVREQGSA